MIYTEPILRYAISENEEEFPVIEQAVWAYAPDHPLAVALPHEIFAAFTAMMIEAAVEMNDALKAEFDADMAAWLKMDKGDRPEKPTLRRAEEPVNGWVLADGNWMVDGDASVSLDIYSMPPKPGWKFVSREEYDKAVAAFEARSEAEKQAAIAAGLKHRQSDWDIKSDVYRKVGLTEGDIAVVLGERPADSEQPTSKKGKR